jgi:ketosteroid isomerase-like protein
MTNASGTVIEAVEKWRQAFEATDPEQLKGLWERDHPTVSYLPTESSTILRAMADIDAYYDNMCQILKDLAFRWHVWDLCVDTVEHAIAFADCYFEMNSPLSYWQGRASFIFKKKADGWRLIHYQDSTVMDWMLPAASRYIETKLQGIGTALSTSELAEVERLIGEANRPIGMADLPKVEKSERQIPGFNSRQ